MTQEQDNALKVIEKLISDMKCHVLSTEEIMILIKGIMSNDCDNSCYTPLYIPNHQGTSPNISPGEIYCRTNQSPNLELYSTTCTTTLEELPNHLKGENEMLEEYRKKILIKDGNLEIW